VGDLEALALAAGSALFLLVGLQLVISWIEVRVLKVLAEREDLIIGRCTTRWRNVSASSGIGSLRSVNER